MLLAANKTSTPVIITSIQTQLRQTFPLASLSDYMERVDAPSDTILIRRGEPSDAMYFLESGQFNVQLETAEGGIIRLRSLRRGTVIGEISMYLNSPRTADVITTKDSVLYRLTSESLRRMEAKQPETAAALHEWIAKQMAERLADNNETIEALLD